MEKDKSKKNKKLPAAQRVRAKRQEMVDSKISDDMVLYSINEASALLNIGAIVVRRLVKDGKLKAHKIGRSSKGRIRIPLSAIKAYLDSSEM